MIDYFQAVFHFKISSSSRSLDKIKMIESKKRENLGKSKRSTLPRAVAGREV